MSDFIDPALIAGELIMLLSCIVGVWLHEAGHALAGHWGGLPPRLIQIGFGPTLARWRFGRLVVVVHAVPIMGLAGNLPQPNATPRAYAIKAAGGPAANALVFGLAAGALVLWPDWEDVIDPILVAQAALVIVNLVPFRIRPKGQIRQSDGMQLLRYARGELSNPFETSYKAALAPVFPTGLPIPPPSPDAPELLFHCLRPDRWTDKWARNDAEEEVALLLDAKRLTRPERALALNFLLTNELAFGDTGVTDEWMIYWSEEAILLLPDKTMTPPAVLLAHAGVLARVGDGAQAETILDSLMGRLRLPASVVSSRIYMAQAASQQGRQAEAADWVAQDRAAVSGPTRKALLHLVRLAERRPPLAPVARPAMTPG